MRRNQLQFTRHTLYNLKRRYGVPADLYRITAAVTNPGTGRTTKTKVKYHIRKLIWFPTTVLSQMHVPAQYKNPSPNFPSQDIDTTSTTFLLDQRDVTGIPRLENTDYFVVGHHSGKRRYDIMKAVEMEDGVGYLISARYMVGGQRNEIFDTGVVDSLIINQVAAN